MLLVSHDRDFLDRTVTVTLGLDGSGSVDIVAGGYADWERRRAAPKNVTTKPKAAPVPERPKQVTKLSYKDQRDYDGIPARIDEIDKAIARDEAALADSALYVRDPSRFAALTAAIDAARAEKAAAEDRWLMLAEMVESLSASTSA